MGEQEAYMAALELAELKGALVPAVITKKLDDCMEKYVSVRTDCLELNDAVDEYICSIVFFTFIYTFFSLFHSYSPVSDALWISNRQC